MNAWRPEVAILRAHGSSIAGPTGGVERVDSRRLANIRSAPSPEGPPLLDRTTPARKTRLPARPHPITFLPTTTIEFNNSTQNWEVKERKGKVRFIARYRSACLEWEQQNLQPN
jgi:hypothetical protein